MLDLYLAEKNNDINEERARITTNFYKRFVSALTKNKKLNTYTKDDFISVLIEMNLMTNGSYLQAKSLVLDYLTWLEGRGEISASQIKEFSKISFDDIDLTALYSRHYFKSFNELWISIESAIQSYLQRQDYTEEFDNFRCAAYLSWYGFSPAEIAEVKKDDLDYETAIVYKGNGEKRQAIKVCDKCMALLWKHKKAEGYISIKSGHYNGNEMFRYKYVDSEYLMRSYKKRHFLTTNVNSLSDVINKGSLNAPKVFTFKRIKLSGMYYCAYLEETENGKLLSNDYDRLAKLFMPEKVGELTNSDKSILRYKRLAEYEKYKQIFYAEI